MVEAFLELVDVLEVIPPTRFENSVDITVEDDESFLLASGVVSHNSASSAFRKYRDPTTQGAFPLRGKFINVLELPNTRVIQNQEVKDLLSATGLKMGEEPKDLRYGKILIYSDADPDGDAIAGLLVNFFGKYWPELFAQGRICRVRTPLVVVKKGTSEKHVFYSAAEFAEWESKSKNLESWDISYKKGLAALEDSDYKDIIERPNMYTFQAGSELRSVLNAWFGGDVSIRKQKMLGLPEEDEEESVPVLTGEASVAP